MSDQNPLVLYHQLRDTLRRYIPTTLPISRRYPHLRQAFRELIGDRELVKGPFLEALPDFEKGVPLRALLRSQGGFLHDGLAALPKHVLDRPLHLHQEQALRAACQDGESLLVATGTGSGKTETFLYPIAHRLLDDPRPDRPGVSCLLIYPMNALANDQLYYRIAPLFGRELADAGISFGRFTSQIRAKTRRDEEISRLRENDRLMAALGGQIPDHWRLIREEMLDSPPRILITNYAMLEHLLLLPRNAPLFARDRLECVVLDEIHTYSGAQATEVAYLLRKLKNRLGLERQLQVFGTSASLPEGGDNDARIRMFAADLFGEPVHQVIRGRRIPHQGLSRSDSRLFSLNTGTWIGIGKVLAGLAREQELDVTGWRDGIIEAGLSDRVPPLPAEHKELSPVLEAMFVDNREIRAVSQVLTEGSVLAFTEVAARVFASEPDAVDDQRSTALSAVIHLGMLARAHADAFPLLPARYHLAASGIEGISVALDGNATEGWRALKPLRVFTDDTGQYFPMLVCRKCGQPYLEGFEHQDRLHNRRPLVDDGQVRRHVFWLGRPPEIRTADEEDLDADQPDLDQNQFKQRTIDPLTGKTCVNTDLLYNHDLVHEFDTDVVLWRFAAPIPTDDAVDANLRQWAESFARTLAETLRFTAAEYLDIQANELRATFRLRGRSVEIVLYDVVAGGAGYCVRLADASVKTLLAAAVRRLDCDADCSSACTNCLCDYSNQTYWDQLNRKPVQAWLADLSDEAPEDLYPGLGLQRWQDPSLEELVKALKSARQIHLLAPRLYGDQGNEERSLVWLLDLMNARIVVNLHLLEKPVTSAAEASSTERRILRHLSPYLEDGRLCIDRLPAMDPTDLARLPRIIAGLDEGAPAWFSVLPTAPLLQCLLPQPVYRGELQSATACELRRLLEAAESLPADAFQPALPMQRWELAAGDLRSLKDWFAPVVDQHVAKIDIKDPYCGAGPHQSAALVELIKFLAGVATTIDRLVVHGKELSFRDRKYQPRHLVQRQLTETVSKVYSGNLLVLIQEFQKSRHFHDRTIDIALIDENGCEIEYRYDLTGGIDFLLDPNKATKLFCYRVER